MGKAVRLATWQLGVDTHKHRLFVRDSDLSDYDQTVELSFKNDRLARLDHIIDSSIAAVLGVGAGGIMSAWLALRITRSRPRGTRLSDNSGGKPN
jgi:hypothetical protein